MQTIHLHEKAGSDGALSLRIPLGQPDAEYDVVVLVQPKKNGNTAWPADYFDTTFGSIDDPSFERPPQGDMPKPVSLA